MSKIVRRLAAAVAIVVVFCVPSVSFAAVPVEQDRGESTAGVSGMGEVWWGFWAWVGSVFGLTGSDEGATAAPPPAGSTGTGNSTNSSGGGGENGPGTDPNG